MIIDKQLLFSENQALTAVDSVSTNIIDTGSNADVGHGHPVEVLVRISEAINNLTGLTVELQTSATANFSSFKVLQQVPAPELAQNTGITFSTLPPNFRRYIRLGYKGTGSTAPTTGKVYAALVLDRQGNVPTAAN